METQTTLPVVRSQGSWGAVISMLIILAIVVAGAYYAFTDRFDTSPTSAPSPSQPEAPSAGY